MNAAEKLIAKGKAEGKAEGESKGIWIGRIQLIQEFLGTQSPEQADLSALSVAELESLFQELQSRYNADFKGK